MDISYRSNDTYNGSLKVNSTIHEIDEEPSDLIDYMNSPKAETESEEPLMQSESPTIENQPTQNEELLTKLETIQGELTRANIENIELVSKLSTLQEQLDQLSNENKELKAKLQSVDQKSKKLASITSANYPTAASETIIEDEELDNFVNFTPTKKYPRDSIGSWSTERMKKNLSVKELVNSMEGRGKK